MRNVEIYPKEGMFCRTLPWRNNSSKEMIHRWDASMSLIRKYGSGSARPETPTHK